MKVTIPIPTITILLLSVICIGMDVVKAASLRLLDNHGEPLPVGSYRKSRNLLDEMVVKDSGGCGPECEADDDDDNHVVDDDDNHVDDDDNHVHEDDDESEISTPIYSRRYGGPITVEFNILDDELNKYVYIGLFEEDGDDFDHYPLALWSGTCGTQKSYYDTCNSGTIVFDFESGHDEDQYFPIRPAFYQLCIMDESLSYPGTKLDCTDLKIRKMKEEQIDDTTISTPDDEYSIDDEDIHIDFTVPKPIAGQWIGLISVDDFEDLKDENVLPDKDIVAWTYSGGCDKEEYTKCWKKVNDGSVDIVHGYFKHDGEEYKPCLIYDMNEPFTQWKCGSSFTVYTD